MGEIKKLFSYLLLSDARGVFVYNFFFFDNFRDTRFAIAMNAVKSRGFFSNVIYIWKNNNNCSRCALYVQAIITIAIIAKKKGIRRERDTNKALSTLIRMKKKKRAKYIFMPRYLARINFYPSQIYICAPKLTLPYYVFINIFFSRMPNLDCKCVTPLIPSTARRFVDYEFFMNTEE